MFVYNTNYYSDVIILADISNPGDNATIWECIGKSCHMTRKKTRHQTRFPSKQQEMCYTMTLYDGINRKSLQAFTGKIQEKHTHHGQRTHIITPKHGQHEQ